MKKISKAIVAASLLTLNSASFAGVEGLVCEEDARPVDGVYKSVVLQADANGKFDLIETVITPGFGSPVETRTATLAEGLTCNILGTLADCFKRGQHRNSWAKFYRVEETSLRGNNPTDTFTQTFIKIEVSSPKVSGLKKEFKFLESHTFGGCHQLFIP